MKEPSPEEIAHAFDHTLVDHCRTKTRYLIIKRGINQRENNGSGDEPDDELGKSVPYFHGSDLPAGFLGLNPGSVRDLLEHVGLDASVARIQPSSTRSAQSRSPWSARPAR